MVADRVTAAGAASAAFSCGASLAADPPSPIEVWADGELDQPCPSAGWPLLLPCAGCARVCYVFYVLY